VRFTCQQTQIYQGGSRFGGQKLKASRKNLEGQIHDEEDFQGTENGGGKGTETGQRRKQRSKRHRKNFIPTGWRMNR